MDGITGRSVSGGSAGDAAAGREAFDGMGARRVTAADVAEAAGVSRSAVSRCFTPGASIAPQTRARVLEAAGALGYRPNALARGLIRQRSEIVGVVLGSLTNPFLSALGARLLARLQASGRRTLLFQAARREELGEIIEAALSYQVEAVVVTGFTPAHETARRCREAGAPLVVVNRAVPPGYPGHAVATDHEGGGRLAAGILHRAGYRRVAVLAGVRTMSVHRARLAGFEAGLAAHGLVPVAVREATFDHGAALEGALDLLGAREHPDALFCSGDLLAFGALDAARACLGLRVPQDLGVLGFDDVPMAAWPAYDLSTIRQPVESIVEGVVEALARRDGPLAAVALPPLHVPRGTIRRAG